MPAAFNVFLLLLLLLLLPQDENLGLDPPTYATGGRSVTAKRSSLAAAAVAAVPAAKVVAAQSTAAQSTVPPVAGDGAAKAAALTANSTSTASPAGLHATAGTPAASAPAATAVRPPSADAPLQQQPRQAPAVPAPAPAPEPAAAATSVEAAAAPAALTGSAAILAKLRQQRQSSSASGRDSSANASKAGREAKITVLYASQTGTGQEIARSIHAECAAKGLPAQVMSMNELGFDNLTPAKTPVVVVVASSTGECLFCVQRSTRSSVGNGSPTRGVYSLALHTYSVSEQSAATSRTR